MHLAWLPSPCPATAHRIYSLYRQLLVQNGVVMLLSCELCFRQMQGRQGYVQLSNVSYGAAGPFTISFWVKPTQLLGGGLAYLYSHNASMPGNQPIKPNQVQSVCCESYSSIAKCQISTFRCDVWPSCCAGPGVRARTDTSL
jgi:hypothetical protein